MKHFSTLFFMLLVGSLAFGQVDCANGRYNSEIFTNFTIEQDIKYGENIQPTLTDPNGTQELFLDVYQPFEDTLQKRPLIIWAFGGAFVFGSRTSADIVRLSGTFAKMGYVCAAIDYRLTTDLALNGSERLATMAVLKATHDMRAAVRFFRQNAAMLNEYNIDPDRIYVGGVSAGGLAALHLAYLDELSEIPASIAADTAGLGGIEGLSGNPGYSSEVSGVINLCGALGDKKMMQAGDVPLVSLHGDEDGTVPYGSDIVTLFNINLPVDGSGAIHPWADTVGVRNALYTFVGAGHTPFVGFTGIVPTYMDTVVTFVKDFLHEELCGPSTAIADLKTLEMQVYPNPFDRQVRIQWEGSIGVSNLEVYDISGRKQAIQVEREGNSFLLHRGDLLAGLHFYVIRDQKGRQIAQGKIMAQ